MSTDQQIEQEIQAKGLTAPRVTPADIEANIASEHYFTAADTLGIQGSALRVASDGDLPTVNTALNLLTFCVLVLKNGFTVTGESACASPENFDAEVGKQIARFSAVNKIWPLMGYALKQQLHDIKHPRLPGATTFQDRVRAEATELDERLKKLVSFFPTDTFAALPPDEQERLHAQAAAMTDYSNCLSERIAAFAA